MSTLYERVLGADYPRLAPLLQKLHREHEQHWQGEADVRWASQRWLRVLLWLGRLPAEGTRQPCSITLRERGKRELWQRSFGQRRMASTQHADGDTLYESFGPFRLQLASTRHRTTLEQHSVATRMLGMRLPARWALRVQAIEREYDGRLHFDVRIGIGPALDLLHYQGWLLPAGGAPCR
ncbi:protein of unknown function [Andreprevotia lacus DSM 23236]|jgi:hypothetical protein|uniref:DUF4166 domain-containing protein n=1 Tax=Andreprevotia lacus DSM 23236 TaxID=1121001 RepID=A0A1W1XVE8_9NEIS|nr:DUF4166 domain-containing protein [Andreprevotia lacus]SMC27508.1 protein of unknown function [Andreprevotia lacus DSM 23236]